MNLHHPLVASALAPLVVSLVAAGLIRAAGGADAGRRSACAAIGIAVFVATLLILGSPSWPPVSVGQKLPYLIAVATLAGIALDAGRKRTRSTDLPAVIVSVASVAWMAWPQLVQGRVTAIAAAVVVALVMAAICMRLASLRDDGAIPLVMLVVAGLGLAGIAFVGASLALAQFGAALAAAAGGFALWNWPRARFPFGAAGLLVSAAALATLATLIVLATGARPWALVPIAAVFYADLVSGRFTPGRGATRRALAPVVLAAIAVVLAGAGVFLAQGAGAPDHDLYYH
jgi:hypothetical protein